MTSCLQTIRVLKSRPYLRKRKGSPYWYIRWRDPVTDKQSEYSTRTTDKAGAEKLRLDKQLELERMLPLTLVLGVKCGVCKKEKPREEFSKGKGRKNGLRWCCKKCDKVKHKEYHDKKREENLSIIKEIGWEAFLKEHHPTGIKRCSVTKKEYPATLDYFSKDVNIPCGLHSESRLGKAYRQAKNKHEDRSPDQEMISLEEFEEIYFGDCYYGLSRPHVARGVDRIDSSKGYIKGNVRSVCVAHNRMKLDSSEEDFVEYCKEVVESNRIREEQRVNVTDIIVKVGV